MLTELCNVLTLDTLTRYANFHLSSGPLPLAPGYSKSRSIPSKFRCRRKSIVLVINSSWFCGRKKNKGSFSLFGNVQKFISGRAAESRVTEWVTLLSLPLSSVGKSCTHTRSTLPKRWHTLTLTLLKAWPRGLDAQPHPCYLRMFTWRKSDLLGFQHFSHFFCPEVPSTDR